MPGPQFVTWVGFFFFFCQLPIVDLNAAKPKTQEHIFSKHYPQPLKQFIINGIIGATRLKSCRVGQSPALPPMFNRYIGDFCKIAQLLRVTSFGTQNCVQKKAQFWLKLNFSKVQKDSNSLKLKTEMTITIIAVCSDEYMWTDQLKVKIKDWCKILKADELSCACTTMFPWHTSQTLQITFGKYLLKR